MDKLNEERLEKTNRVKLVEREKAALEAAKKEADAYVKDQNQLTMRQSELYQVYQLRYQANMAIAAEAVVRHEAARFATVLTLYRLDRKTLQSNFR